MHQAADPPTGARCWKIRMRKKKMTLPGMLLASPAAAAEGSVTYVPGAGGDVVRNLAGRGLSGAGGRFYSTTAAQARQQLTHAGASRSQSHRHCVPPNIPDLGFPQAFPNHPLAAEPGGCRAYLVPVGNFPCSAAAQACQQLAHAGALPLLIATTSFGCWAVSLVLVAPLIIVLLRNGSNASHRQARRADYCSQDGFAGCSSLASSRHCGCSELS